MNNAILTGVGPPHPPSNVQSELERAAGCVLVVLWPAQPGMLCIVGDLQNPSDLRETIQDLVNLPPLPLLMSVNV